MINKNIPNANQKVVDRLVEVFLKNKSSSWRKIMLSSKHWEFYAASVIDRMGEQITDSTTGSDLALFLRNSKETLTRLHEELLQFNRIIQDFRHAPAIDYDVLFVTHWTNLNRSFFEHIDYLITDAFTEGKTDELQKLLSIRTKILLHASIYNELLGDPLMMQNAFRRLQHIFDSSSNMQDLQMLVEKKMTLGKVDAASLLSVSKANASVRNSSYAKTEIGEIMAYVYFEQRKLLAWNRPVEVRILKYLMSIDDPAQLEAELDRAVTKGPLSESRTHDFLYTSLDVLRLTVNRMIATIQKTDSEKKKRSTDIKIIEKGPLGRLVRLQNLIAAKEMA